MQFRSFSGKIAVKSKSLEFKIHAAKFHKKSSLMLSKKKVAL